MSNGLTQLDDGRWRARVSGRDADGHRQQVMRTFPTKAEAKKWQAITLAAMAKGTFIARKALTFDQVADRWLEDKELSVRPVTYRGYVGALKHARPTLGALPVQRITTEHVRQINRAMARAGKSKATVALTLLSVKAVLERAVDDRLIPYNPAAKVEALGADAVQRAHLPAADADKIAAHVVGDRLEGCWLLSLLGLRRSEVMALRWSDVDLEQGWVHITRGRVHMGKGHDVIGDPKSKVSKRDVPIGPATVEGLKRMRAVRAEERKALMRPTPLRDDDYLAVTVAGNPINPEWYSDLWLGLCDTAGVPRVTLHAARHGSVTRMRNDGTPGHLVAAFHGHTEKIMAGTYSHAEEQELRRIAR